MPMVESFSTFLIPVTKFGMTHVLLYPSYEKLSIPDTGVITGNSHHL